MVQTADQFAEGIIERIKQQYNALGLRASGNFEKELEKQVVETDLNIHIEVLGTKYSGVLLTGRKPNRDQSKEGLRKFAGYAGNTFLKQWVKDKGLAISPFAVAYGIARHGIKVPNSNNPGTLLETALPENTLNEYVASIVDAVVKDLRIGIKPIA